MSGYYPFPPPYYGPPIMYPPMNPQSPPASGLSPKEIKRAIRFHQKIIETYEADKKKKEDGKKKDGDKKPPAFSTLQWTAFLVATSPLLGLFYLKLMAQLAASIPH